MNTKLIKKIPVEHVIQIKTIDLLSYLKQYEPVQLSKIRAIMIQLRIMVLQFIRIDGHGNHIILMAKQPSSTLFSLKKWNISMLCIFSINVIARSLTMAKRFISKKDLARIKELDLLTYLKNYEPQELVKKSRNDYVTRTHGSLHISNGLWCCGHRTLEDELHFNISLK